MAFILAVEKERMRADVPGAALKCCTTDFLAGNPFVVQNFSSAHHIAQGMLP